MAQKIGLLVLAGLSCAQASLIHVADNGADRGAFGVTTPIVSFNRA